MTVFQCRRDLTGMVFGRLTVISRVYPIPKNGSKWNVRCVCGVEKKVDQSALLQSRTRSCGCYKVQRTREVHSKHNKTNTKVYRTWDRIIQRCTNKTHPRYKDWGGRGISVCKKWLDFKNFYKDIGHPPTKTHSLGRIDNNKGYFKQNCRWETSSEQMSNRRNTVYATVRGITKPICIWVKEFGIKRETFASRVRLGWTPEKAITTIVKKTVRNIPIRKGT